MSSIWFNVLDVGQGSGNYIEFFDDNTELTAAVIIDMGSEDMVEEAGGPSANYVVASLQQMDQPTLEAVLLSHSDTDHINLIKDVLKPFKPYNPKKKETGKGTLWIKNAAYGAAFGEYKKHGGKNVVDEITRYMNGGEPKYIPATYSSFKPTGNNKIAPIITVSDVKFYLLIANTWRGESDVKRQKTALADRKRKRSYAKSVVNTDSLVVVVDYGGVQLVATGDATGITLKKCNEVMTQEIKDGYLNNVVMVTLPHHGSERTTFNYHQRGGDTPEENLTNFVNNIRGQSITGSAGLKSTFKHPSAEVMKFFWPKLSRTTMWSDDTLSGRHFYTAYFMENDDFTRIDADGDVEDWPDKDNWHVVQTADNVYTNLYYYASLAGQANTVIPPDGANVEALPDDMSETDTSEGVAWTYRVSADGKFVLFPQTNRMGLRRLSEAMRAGVMAADLPHLSAEELWGGRQGPEARPATAVPRAPGSAPPRRPATGGPDGRGRWDASASPVSKRGPVRATATIGDGGRLRGLEALR